MSLTCHLFLSIFLVIFIFHFFLSFKIFLLPFSSSLKVLLSPSCVPSSFFIAEMKNFLSVLSVFWVLLSVFWNVRVRISFVSMFFLVYAHSMEAHCSDFHFKKLYDIWGQSSVNSHSCEMSTFRRKGNSRELFWTWWL